MNAPSSSVAPVLQATQQNSVPQPAQAPQKTPSYRFNPVIPWIVSASVCLTIFLIILIVLPMDSWFGWKRVVAEYITGTEYVLVGRGVMGDGYFDVTIKRAYLKKPGWLVVSAVAQEYDMRCAQVYGKSELLPAGKIKNATIRLPNIVPDVIEETTNQPALIAGTEVTVGIAYDNGTGSFENPILLRDKTGALIFGRTRINIAK